MSLPTTATVNVILEKIPENETECYLKCPKFQNALLMEITNLKLKMTNLAMQRIGGCTVLTYIVKKDKLAKLFANNVIPNTTINVYVDNEEGNNYALLGSFNDVTSWSLGRQFSPRKVVRNLEQIYGNGRLQ